MRADTLCAIGAGVILSVALLGCSQAPKDYDNAGLSGAIVAEEQSSEETLIFQRLDEWKQNFLNKDLDALMKSYSIYFVSSYGLDRDEQRVNYAKTFKKKGPALQAIDFEAAQIDVRATVSPVRIISDNNTADYKFLLRKEGGEWLLDSIEIISALKFQVPII